jgi:hypothetical protein
MDRQQRITRFEYSAYILFHDILNDNDMIPVNFEPILKKYSLRVLEDTSRNGFSDDLIVDDKMLRKVEKSELLFEVVQNESFSNLYSVEKRRLGDSGINTVQPPQFKATYISNIEASSLIYDSGSHRWITKDALLRAERIKFNEFQRKINEEILKKYVDFNSAKNLEKVRRDAEGYKVYGG